MFIPALVCWNKLHKYNDDKDELEKERDRLKAELNINEDENLKDQEAHKCGEDVIYCTTIPGSILIFILLRHYFHIEYDDHGDPEHWPYWRDREAKQLHRERKRQKNLPYWRDYSA